MKKQLFITIGAILALFILNGFWSNANISASSSAQAAPAEQIINPAVIAIDPVSAPNDLNTPITITGADFATDLTGTPPTVSLENVALEDVTWVDSATLTAIVPWALDAGLYTLTVTNPDGGTESLTDALTITQSIGQWNGGNMFGGLVTHVLLKPSDLNTVYAMAASVGLFRSRDAGEHWEYTGYNKYTSGNDSYFVDPSNPSRLYSLAPFNGLYRSDNEGDTWTAVFDRSNNWPDGRYWHNGQFFISPHNGGELLFFSSIGDGADAAVGLLISPDGGTNWSIVSDMDGVPVYSMGFHPTDPQKMALGTYDGRVFQSTDGGSHWSEVAKPPLNGVGIVVYNPFTASDEIWVSGAWLHEDEPDIFKSADSALTGWTKVTPVDCTRGGATAIKFTSATSVYVGTGWGWGYHSSNSGSTWDHFGNPSTSTLGHK